MHIPKKRARRLENKRLRELHLEGLLPSSRASYESEKLRNTPAEWDKYTGGKPNYRYTHPDDMSVLSYKIFKRKAPGKTLDLMAGGTEYPDVDTAVDFNRNSLAANPAPNKVLFNVSDITKRRKGKPASVSLPFKDKSFKNITVNFGMNYLTYSKQRLLIKEAKRVLEEGGKLIMIGSPGACFHEVQRAPFQANKLMAMAKGAGFNVEYERYDAPMHAILPPPVYDIIVATKKVKR